MRPRRDLSHPARTKKQIDASSRYNSPPPLPSVDMPISAGHRTTDKTSFIIREARRPRPLDALLKEARQKLSRGWRRVHRACEYFRLLSNEGDRRARFHGGSGKRKRTKFAARGFHPRDPHPRVTVCARRILHTIARIDSVMDLRKLCNDILFRIIEFTCDTRGKSQIWRTLDLKNNNLLSVLNIYTCVWNF